MKTKNKVLLLLFCSLATLLPMVSHASLQAELDGIFGDMTNVTAPGKYSTTRRGVISGGSIVARSRIFDENLIGARMPSLKGGCGGISMFGGSFSYANADQLVELFRAIASNAKGYAFQLALDTVCPQCNKIMQGLQEKIQGLNQHLSNSCQLAQGVVNSTSNLLPFEIKGKTNTTLTGIAKGVGSDFAELSGAIKGIGADEALKTNDPVEYDKKIGNVTWRELSNNNVNSWFKNSPDSELYAAIMSLTGSVIVGDLDGSKDEASRKVTILPGNKLTLNDIIQGGSNVEVYSCTLDPDKCLDAGSSGGGTKKINLEGMSEKIRKMFAGTSSTNGIIYKHATNTGSLTDDEKNFMVNLPYGIGSTFRNLAALSGDAAMTFADSAASPLALQMSYDLAQNLIRAAEVALVASDNDYAPKAIDELKESRRKLNDEFTVLTQRYGKISDLMEQANLHIEATRKARYVATRASK